MVPSDLLEENQRLRGKRKPEVGCGVELPAIELFRHHSGYDERDPLDPNDLSDHGW